MKIILIIILFFLTLSCSNENKSDDALLEEDKKELQENLDSYKVATYKFAKILIRASASKDTISSEFQSFKNDLDRVFNKVTKYDTESLSVLDYISIYRDYKKMETFIEETDEDLFPTLTTVFKTNYTDSITKNKNYLVGKEKEYIQNIEHSILSAIVVLSKDLGKEISLYECAKTKPELLPDSEIKTLLQYFRGFLFFQKGLYYLSEDEISRNIEWLNKNQDINLKYTRLFFKWGNLDNTKTHIGFHSLNHLFRGFDRLMMEREIDEERALKDFEVFLQDAKKIGLDNEIIWSIETYLFLKTEKNKQAITSLKKLGESNLLSLHEKEQIDASIVYLDNREPKKVLNGIYDKYFLSKIATKYMFSILSQVNWKKILKEQDIPHTEEMFKAIEEFNKMVKNLNKYSNGEKIKEVGKDIQKKSKNLWNKAKGLVE